MTGIRYYADMRLGIGGGGRIARGGASVGRGGVRGGVGIGPFSVSGGSSGGGGGGLNFAALLGVLVVLAVIAIAYIALLSVPMILLFLALPGALRAVKSSGSRGGRAFVSLAVASTVGGFLLSLLAHRIFEVTPSGLLEFGEGGPWDQDFWSTYGASLTYALALGGVLAIPSVVVRSAEFRYWASNYRVYRFFTLAAALVAILGAGIGSLFEARLPLLSEDGPGSAILFFGLVLAPVLWFSFWAGQRVVYYGDGSVHVERLRPLSKVADELGFEISCDRLATVTDLMAAQLGRPPRPKDSIEFDGFRFEAVPRGAVMNQGAVRGYLISPIRGNE